ncbi:MAG: 50S ribosomal protein L32e [Candidatus Methanomethylophilus sp.]|jgi:large subunit ribosomal protein L32e|nr:50S ribosomal protein L32e [Methanomethylophilus sp.]MBQ4369131.1 50S ribosomal protein L32e [Methanomethylophilus sp.]MBQ5397234.1 50S ribosomal protein L32e [Methanomethylophilus sp.]MBQ5448356.1 50S ribosomal protein L32e [Methanomethylophilus sp.]MBQ5483730.1 50S ribosomal protein L32e [Methanomethylophilus sp.]
MSVKEFKDLPGFKDANVAELESIGITSVEQLKDAVNDEEKSKQIIKTLSGVGPKTVENWKDAFESKEAAKAAKTEAPKAEVVEAGAYTVEPKPELSEEQIDALAKRAVISGNRPAFKRQEWFRYQKLGEAWRRPRGIHSKMRRGMKRRPPMVEIGYGGPALVRGLHPSGFEEVMVYNVDGLEDIDPKTQAARIGGTVGVKKRIAIENRAKELGIRVLNKMPTTDYKRRA